ncbi:hypothetical protein Tco_0479171 [Tanacetum coccineum]
MVARKPRQPTTVTDEEGGKKKKAPEAGKSKQPAPAKQPKPVKKKTSNPTSSRKIRKAKRFDHLVDEKDEEIQPASEPQVEDDEYNLQRGIQMSLESFQAPIGGVVIREPDPGVIRKLPEVEGKGKDSTNDAENVAVMEQSNNEADTEILNVEEVQGEEVSHTVALEERTGKLDEVQAGSDPSKTPESRPLPERQFMEEDQAGPNPEPMHEDFIATVYPAVHESLKLTTEEQVHIENPPSSSRTLSLIKNLEDAFIFGDQFINDKSTEEEPGKANVETKVESMVTVPIHQASSLVPPLSTPIIDLSPPKPVSPHVQEPIFTTTTTLPPPPSPLPQSATDLDLANRVSALEREIDKQVNEVVKEAVHNALQAPLRERFRDLSEFQMKEILHDRMFESGSYRSHPDHITLYEALEILLYLLQRTLIEARKKKQDSNASASKQPPVQKFSAWKTSDIREAPFSSSKQNPASLSAQPIDENPIPKDMHLSESEDTGAAHLPKIKTRPDWLKPTENNWADALAKTYKDPEENKLLQKTGDMGSFIKWYCKQIGEVKIFKADLEGFKLTSNQIDLMNPEGNRVVHAISKPLPLGGPPGQVTIQAQYFFNKDLEYLVSGNKERRHALLFKLKRAYYPDFGLKELALSLLAGKVKVPMISVQPTLGIESYQTKLNLTQPSWDATGFLFKEDYTILHKPRAVIYKDRNNQNKMIRETEVHKFSDGTLRRILEKLDYIFKYYELYKYNPGMENRIWNEDDKRRSQEFIKLIERRLKIRRIFRSLKSFVSGRIRDIDYRLIDRTE